MLPVRKMKKLRKRVELVTQTLHPNEDQVRCCSGSKFMAQKDFAKDGEVTNVSSEHLCCSNDSRASLTVIEKKPLLLFSLYNET